VTTIRSNIISRHSRNGSALWRLEAENLAPWCRIPGSPFFQGFFLMPNHPNAPKVFVRFGPFDVGPDIDAFSYLVSRPGKQAHRNTINVDLGILEAGGSYFSHSQLCLSWAEAKPVTLSFDPRESRNVYLTFSVSFRDFVDTTTYGGIEVRYLVGHKWNRLTELFNRVGTDKGTEWAAGAGVPHCYSMAYYPLFQGLQEEEFNFLEIGLDNASKNTGRPQDAPSLRAWRQFFRKAKLYGYDINDFSFFSQEGTVTFQGDQASREDVRRFLQECGEPRFRVILDDGSHASSHQQISLGALFPSVEPSGMYLIEDLGWQPFAEVPKTLDVLIRFAETAKFESPFVSDAEARYLEETVSQVEIYKPNDSEFAVIYKKE
jgi:hypothetical protein